MTERCEYGHEYGIGQWPYCKGNASDHGIPGGMLGQYPERWDEHIAPPPSEDFCPKGLPEYVKDKGYRITSLADHKRLLRLTNSDYRGKKPGMPGAEY